MYRIVPYLLLLCMTGACIYHPLALAVVQHHLQVDLEPSSGTLTVHDTVTLSQNYLNTATPLTFTLNAELEPHVDDPTVKLVPVDYRLGAIPTRTFRLQLPKDQHGFSLHYSTNINRLNHDAQQPPEEHPLRGISLGDSNQWYPNFGEQLVSFSLQVKLPKQWTVISQGERTQNRSQGNKTIVQWVETHPQDDIYLIAGPYHEYQGHSPVAQIMVFLHHDDQDLATRYIEATKRYLRLYQQLLGPYPYTKFAMVENILETGYGMPSFTLLGPAVIRLPFILTSSYPHEILHNWWGNGVYVDYTQGNWSEGLTAYLADHLLKEQQGQGAKYRREALQKYTNFVSERSDFPLSEFRSRHGQASQAIGYNKALMLFHMLRLRLGDETFIEGLRLFYQQNRFKRAGYSELRQCFEAVSRHDLEPMFGQWIERLGAPVLNLRDVRMRREGGDTIIEANIEQTQDAAPYSLDVPLSIGVVGNQDIIEKTISLSKKREHFSLRLPGQAIYLQIDPRFDLFRRLDPHELPATLGQVFGAERRTLVLPAMAPTELRQAYRALAQRWAIGNPAVEILWDNDLQELPRDRSLWFFGWENRFRDLITKSLKNKPLVMQKKWLRIGEQTFNRENHSLVLTAKHPDDPQQAIAWLGTDRLQALPGLARKLPHYSKYSYLSFTGDRPSIKHKGQWEVTNSPLRFDFGVSKSNTPSLKPAPRPPLVRFASEKPF
ncbi:MAG: M1 family metallopeptidase [Gammaproteobacteria bacterium]|nr:M1 family metallopeptidase [Gammaproteobacteria bacterium]